jgi:hypothetical protein
MEVNNAGSYSLKFRFRWQVILAEVYRSVPQTQQVNSDSVSSDRLHGFLPHNIQITTHNSPATANARYNGPVSEGSGCSLLLMSAVT